MTAPAEASKTPDAKTSGGERAELIAFMASSSFFQASRLGVNVVAAALVAPASFGLWNLVVVIQTYTAHGSFGLLSGANRRVPMLVGAGSRREARAAENTAFGGSLVVGAGLAVCAAIVGIVLGGPWRVAGPLVGFAVLAQQLHLCGQVVLRGNLQFNHASAQQLLLAFVFPVVGIPAVALYGIEALIAAQGLAYGIGFVVVLALRPDLRPAFDVGLVGSMVREGWPIMLSGLVFAVLTSVDRWAIVTAGTSFELGQYGLASTIAASLMFVNLLVAQQLYPRMAHAFGKSRTLPPVRAIARRQSLLAGGLVFAMALVLVVVEPVVVPRVLPEFAASVPAMQILGLGYAVLAFGSGFTNLLITIGAVRQLLVLEAMIAVAAALGALVALRLGLGLDGVAIAMVVGFGALVVGAAGLAQWLPNRRASVGVA